jgi:hypothetical protein
LFFIDTPRLEAYLSYSVLIKPQTKIATEHKVYNDFSKLVGTATRELYVQFILQVYKMIPDAKLATFGKLKYTCSQNFAKFREYFKAEYKLGFICPSHTFDNVKGKFPIGFLIWDFENKQDITQIDTDIFLNNFDLTEAQKIGRKSFYPTVKNHLMIDWLRNFYDHHSDKIAYLRVNGPDFSNNIGVFFTLSPSANDMEQHFIMNITRMNIIEMCIYLSVRHCIEHTWINDRDQFLYPNDKLVKDVQFHNNCLVFSLLHGQNRISSSGGTNHWIPFTETQVDAKEKFESHYMSDFLKDKTFSLEAQSVLSAGLELWKYYHAKIKSHKNATVNASFYDIREFFQGRKENGIMNTQSKDDIYNGLIKTLREAHKALSKKIEPKVYGYGFLKE